MALTFAVTGVASGIGAELASTLQARGHTVIGFDKADASANVDRYIQMDLNDPASIKAAAAQIDTPLDGLCNNAGIPPRLGTEALILSVNFIGQRQFTKAMVPHLKTGASIANMASRAGRHWPENAEQNKRLAALTSKDQLAKFVVDEGLDPTACYNLSKQAMILWTFAMTEPLLARDIRINAISPAAVSTGILDDFKRAFGDKVTENIARAGRAGTAKEVAEVVAFILSPESFWIKGADLHVDGGMGGFNMTDELGLEGFRLT